MKPISSSYLVVGAGAVGLGVAGALHKGGGKVTIVARAAAAERLESVGFGVEGVLGSFNVPPASIQVITRPEEYSCRPPNAVFVCVKSFDSAEVAAWLGRVPAIRTGRHPIVLCQNGWGNAEVFVEVFPPERVLNACLFTGFERAGEQVEVTVHVRPVMVGGLTNPAERSVRKAAAQAAAALTAGGLPAQPTVDIAREIWGKMCFNCVVNPLAALFDCPLGGLVDDPSARAVLRRVVTEIYAVTTALGQRLEVPTAGEYLSLLLDKLLPSTASHYPSMWHDLREGRRTEIDALNGAVIRLARDLKVFAPANRYLHRAITARRRAARQRVASRS
jgi:2-dehydropantoate 2-reductase